MHAAHTHAPAPAHPIDQNVVDALESSRDRISVLRLEQDILKFLADDERQVLEILSLNSYQRLLAHKTGDYYQLTHVSGPNKQSLLFHKHPWSKVPAVKLCDYRSGGKGGADGGPAASTAPVVPLMRRIMKRDADKAASPPQRQASPTVQDTHETRDKDKSDKEERYRAARARIFEGVEESSIGSTEKGVSPDRNKIKSNTNSRSNSRDARPKSTKRWEADGAHVARGHSQVEQFHLGPTFYDSSFQTLSEGPEALQQRHQQYYHAEQIGNGYQRPVSEPRPFPSVWSPHSSTPLSMANLATLEAQTAKQVSPPTLFSTPNSLNATGAQAKSPPSRSLAPPVVSSGNLWGPPTVPGPMVSRNASAMGLNLGASPWTPKGFAAGGGGGGETKSRGVEAAEENEDDPTNVLRGLALDDK